MLNSAGFLITSSRQWLRARGDELISALSSLLSWRVFLTVRVLSALFGFLLLLLLMNGLLAYASISDIAAREQSVTHAQVVLNQEALILKTLDDAETGQRGYLLTGDQSYLHPYTEARAELPGQLNKLQSLLANDSEQQHDLVKLQADIGAKLDELQQTITLKQQGQTSAALTIVLTGQGQQIMDAVRAELAAMQTSEENSLSQRHLAAKVSIYNATISLILASLIDILLMVGIFFVLIRSLHDRERYLAQEQQARQQAEASVMLRDQFLSLASHELKTPITALLTNMQMLERRLGKESVLTERHQKAFTTMEQQVHRLSALIDAMLDVSRIESGQLSLSYESVDLVTLVRGIAEEMQQTTAEHQCIVASATPHLTVEGDPLRLEQVVRNLLQNAIKYSPDGGFISLHLETALATDSETHVFTTKQQDQPTPRTEAPAEVELAVLRVQDQGIGIPQEAQRRLFERFYRAPNASTSHVAGLGIGLYVVKEIVALHQGDITLESEEGVGTTFTVRLPLAQEKRSSNPGLFGVNLAQDSEEGSESVAEASLRVEG